MMNGVHTIDPAASLQASGAVDREALVEIEKRVLWLSTAMVHHANRVRPIPRD